jgi:eukaryotic-like serine/threonine-protein kinase
MTAGEQPLDELDFATLALAHKLVTREDIEHCHNVIDSEALEGKPRRSVEEVLLEKGLLDEEEIWAIRKAQERMSRDATLARRRIGSYEILEKLGEGGLGIVYKARQLSMGRDVALKVLHKKWAGDEEFRRRFLIEARLVGRLSHQNLIDVYDVGRYKETYFYSMEFIDGENLEDAIERRGPLDVLVAIHVTVQMVGVIQYLHRLQILHRDIKPGNIMLGQGNVAKLMDFGFVKSNLDSFLSSEGEVLGTPDYISPEAARGATDLDLRSDVYSLGASFYHMLAGRPPFTGSPSEVMEKHIVATPPPLRELRPELSDHVIQVVEKMTDKDREARYATAEALFDDLELLRIEERARQGKASAASDTIAGELEAGRLRANELLQDSFAIQQTANRLRRLLKLCIVVIVALALAVLALAFGSRSGDQPGRPVPSAAPSD